MASCQICGKTLTNPASIALGIGPVCAAKAGLLRLVDKERPRKSLHKFDFSCVCPYCGGTIEKVEQGAWHSWRWTCGGVTGDGCQCDFGINTPAPLRIKLRKLKSFGEFDRFEQYKLERKYYAEVARLSKERLGYIAVPPYHKIGEEIEPKLKAILDEASKTYEGKTKQSRLDE